MEFCSCGGLMISKKDEKNVLICRICGKIKKINNDNGNNPYKLVEKVEKTEDIILVDKKDELLPKTKIICAECNNKEAVWWIQQTRSSDESPTTFFRCTKCQHTWRSYD